jgi:hypothetical protein
MAASPNEMTGAGVRILGKVLANKASRRNGVVWTDIYERISYGCRVQHPKWKSPVCADTNFIKEGQISWIDHG